MENTESQSCFIFQLMNDNYAIPVKRVEHILEYQQATRVPETPDYLEGIINVRGKLIPLINTRLKFGLPQEELPDEACILITEVKAEQGELKLGLLVDRARDVISIADDKLEDVPDLGLNLNPEYVRKVANIREEIFLLLNLDRVFSTKEITRIREKSENK